MFVGIERLSSLAAAGLLAAVLSGCGGGGGSPPVPPPGGSAPVGSPPVVSPVPPESGVRSHGGGLAEPRRPREPASWETAEYKRSTGLALIDASGGYARRAAGRPGGEGITVAVLDNGVDFSHPDLARGRFDGETAFRSARFSREHGTPVAGIVAARRDGSGVHGVAYKANLRSIATCGIVGGCAGDPPHADSVDTLAASIASAAGLTRTYGSVSSKPAASSHIVNMSFAYPGLRNVPPIARAMRDAAGAGRVMVAVLGNCGDGGDECAANNGRGALGAPAAHVANPGIAGFAIAVGSLDESGAGRAAHSNTCGPVKEYCLFAPGERIRAARAGGGHDWVEGTSFAAPHVSGAAAVVWAAFPHKDGAEIVERLLTTARPLDGQKISDTFGRGALDLGAAMNPVGSLSLPAGAAGPVPLADSFVDLPPGFGAPSGAAALAGAVVYDEQMFPFRRDLAALFRPAGRRASEGALRAFLSAPGEPSRIVPLGRRAALQFAHGGDAFDPHGTAADRDRGTVRDWRLRFAPAPDLAVAVGPGVHALGSSNGFAAARVRRAVFRDAWAAAPFAALAGRGPGLSLDWRVDGDTQIDFAGKRGEGYSGSARARLASLGIVRRFGGRIVLGARVGALRESGSSMGIRAGGAFAGAADAATRFLDLGVEGRVSDGVTLFGSLSRGVASGGAPERASLVSQWGSARAGSFAVGAEAERLWLASDRLTLTASSPFRARGAAVRIDVPDREVADGVVRYTSRVVDLAPRGREIRLQAAYEMQGGDGVSAAVGGYARIEPGHDDSAAPEFGAAAKIRLAF